MWGCREPKGGGEIGRREGGHPLKLQRGTGKGETRQRAKEDARRTRQVLDQWEGRKKLFAEKRRDKRGDWLGGSLRGSMTREEEGDWGKVGWSGEKKSEGEERTERRRFDWVGRILGEFGAEEVGEWDEAARAKRDDWGREVLGGGG